MKRILEYEEWKEINENILGDAWKKNDLDGYIDLVKDNIKLQMDMIKHPIGVISMIILLLSGGALLFYALKNTQKYRKIMKLLNSKFTSDEVKEIKELVNSNVKIKYFIRNIEDLEKNARDIENGKKSGDLEFIAKELTKNKYVYEKELKNTLPSEFFEKLKEFEKEAIMIDPEYKMVSIFN